MNRSRRALHRALRAQAPQVPQETLAAIRGTLSSLTPEPEAPARSALRWAAAILTLAFFILPNISRNIAYAMQELPLIGQVVRVISVYKLEQADGPQTLAIDMPQVEGAAGLAVPIDAINADVQALTDLAIARFRQDTASYPQSHQSLTVSYEVLTNSDQWFTLRVLVHYDAGSGTPMYYYYHIDKQRCQLVSLSDLFIPQFDYVSALSREIKEQMAAQMEADPSLVYWTYDNSNTCCGFYEISHDQSFYWNENGELVIVFGKYDVGPGSMGCPEFVIPQSLYRSSLRN